MPITILQSHRLSSLFVSLNLIFLPLYSSDYCKISFSISKLNVLLECFVHLNLSFNEKYRDSKHKELVCIYHQKQCHCGNIQEIKLLRHFVSIILIIRCTNNPKGHGPLKPLCTSRSHQRITNDNSNDSRWWRKMARLPPLVLFFGMSFIWIRVS